MSVYHCPLCPLIFPYRSEVERHLREEHRSRVDEEADLRTELGPAASRLDWDRLEELRSSAHTPSVSLMLGTTPATSMTVLDVARLRQLADRARRRLSAEPERGSAAPIVAHRLSRAVAAAEGSATERGLAVLVSEHDLAIITLPFKPRDRAAVDLSFATRDLEYALRRYPVHRILVLGHRPRVMEGRGKDLVEVPTSARKGARRGPFLNRLGSEAPDADHLLDEATGTSGLLPLVVVGDRRRLTAFRDRSRHAESIAAEAVQPKARPLSVTALAEEALPRWHLEQQARAVAELERANADEQVAWGVIPAWRSVTARTAERIWVEHDFACPGRIVPGVDGVETAADPAEPGVIDDLLDTLIARAGRLGISVVLLDPGTLGHDEPIAARISSTAVPPQVAESPPDVGRRRCKTGAPG